MRCINASRVAALACSTGALGQVLSKHAPFARQRAHPQGLGTACQGGNIGGNGALHIHRKRLPGLPRLAVPRIAAVMPCVTAFSLAIPASELSF